MAETEGKARGVINLLAPLPDASVEEIFDLILEKAGARIERIVSQGQTTPDTAPYDQPYDEWVMLLAGGARLWLEDRGECAFSPGDALLIPAHVRHRVVWTQAAPPTVWLAVHFAQDPPAE
ncbi:MULTISPECIES: cupin domain-containing protein [unclassified Sphingobium]|uniref:cupin domain-containing protein n=1 Tax=unclassified Sphingobium TaxID=2611147 RepID=UPI002224F97A|nr:MULTISPECIES: cupin domain-containing protein [unclassified Sphingobium]MCW2381777.1 cupin 2 domain-containing protein [Sphingobium sp. B2D3B]MCW2398117.1 cupin 2 domain-containing protein [Sphingobium sp. B2D3C]